MRKGFTLLELIVVIIIIGILATMAFTQYTKIIERGRTAEAKNNVGLLRRLQIVNYQEKGEYEDDISEFELDLPTTSCNNKFYFRYSCSGGTCTATRCTSGGKAPQGPSGYTVVLDIDGNLESGY